MNKRKPLTNEEGEVREITASDIQQAKRFNQLPKSMQTMFRKRGLQKAPTKEQISIRLSRGVLDSVRALGEGWQTKMDAALQDWLRSHKPA